MSNIFEDFTYKFNESVALVKMAKALLKQDKNSEAISILDNALILNSQNGEATLYKGIALYKLKKYPEALKHFNKLLEKETPFKKESWFYKGLCYKALKEFQTAENCFQTSLKLSKCKLNRTFWNTKKELGEIKNQFIFEKEKMKEIVKFEDHNQKTITKIELIREIGLSIDDADYFFNLLNTPIKYVPEEIPDLKKLAAKILRIRPVKPSFYGIITYLDLDIRMAQKLKAFLINEKLVLELPRFPSPNLPAIVQEPPKTSAQGSNQVEPVEPSIQNEFPCWELIHPSIQSISKDLFENGHYTEAVFDAFKEINTSVKKILREKTGDELDGKSLMFQAFKLNLDKKSKQITEDPVIILDDLTTQTGRDIQEGYMYIFGGAMSAIRNPKAHENIIITKAEAIHHIFLASQLMNKLDEALGVQKESN